MATCAILGAGSWAIALANLIDHNGHQVRMWEFDPAEAQRLSATREDRRKLPGIRIPTRIQITNKIEENLIAADFILFVVPSHIVRGVAKLAFPFLRGKKIIVNLAKGLETESLATMSEVLKTELSTITPDDIVSLSGPSHAEEVSRQMPTSVVVAGRSEKTVESTQQLFANNFFRVYTNNDLIGVELAGALKNIVAIAAGIVDGLGYGDNTKGALITRGLAEITRLGLKKGARSETFAGLAGLGDLVTTCLSRHSRNRYLGEQIGKGQTLEEALAAMTMVAEGVKTTAAAYKLAQLYRVEMPITEQVYQILYEGKNPGRGLQDLMNRPLKAEV